MYFQSVYARLESDTDVGAAIVAANKAAQLALTPGKLVDYMPHLSLGKAYIVRLHRSLAPAVVPTMARLCLCVCVSACLRVCVSVCLCVCVGGVSVYGDFTDADKVEAIRELDKALSGLEFNIESVQVGVLSGRHALHCTAHTLSQVWSTQGEVSEWYLVDEIPFSAVPEAPAASQADQGTDERKDSDS